MARKNLFTYGTLEDPRRLRAIIGRRPASTEALLLGYRCFLLRGESYPAIVPDPSCRTPGTLYLGLDEKELAALDRYEGDWYDRAPVVVKVAGGRERSAEAYLLDAGRHELVSDRAWDRRRFLRRTLHSTDGRDARRMR